MPGAPHWSPCMNAEEAPGCGNSGRFTTILPGFRAMLSTKPDSGCRSRTQESAAYEAKWLRMIVALTA